MHSYPSPTLGPAAESMMSSYRILPPIELPPAPSPTSAVTSFSTLKVPPQMLPYTSLELTTHPQTQGSFPAPAPASSSRSPPPHPHDPIITPQKAPCYVASAVLVTKLPPTPATTPQKGSKRSSPSHHHHEAATPPSKRLRTDADAPSTPSPSTRRTLFRRNSSTPKFSIAYKAPASPTAFPHAPRSAREQSHNDIEPDFASTYKSTRSASLSKKAKLGVSPLEIERVAESVLRQVDWEEVSRDVAGNRAGRVYRRVVGRLLLGEGVEELSEEQQ